jgi:hypothetical protein
MSSAWSSIVVVLAAATIVACRSESRTSENGPALAHSATAAAITPTQRPAPVATVSGVQLLKEYLDNPARADSLYEKKRVRVSGKIGQIGTVKKDAFIKNTTYYVTLDGLATSSVSGVWINCTFSEGHASEIATLNRGSTITVDGTCKGLQTGLVQSVDLDDCDLVPASSTPLPGGHGLMP